MQQAFSAPLGMVSGVAYPSLVNVSRYLVHSLVRLSNDGILRLTSLNVTINPKEELPLPYATRLGKLVYESFGYLPKSISSSANTKRDEIIAICLFNCT